MGNMKKVIKCHMRISKNTLNLYQMQKKKAIVFTIKYFPQSVKLLLISSTPAITSLTQNEKVITFKYLELM
jgi:hypothetical protein